MASTGPGIDGNRKAVAITLPDGSVVWVMGRCGNPVVLGTSPVPASPLAPAPVTPPAPAPEVPTPGTTPGTPPPGTTTPPETCPPDMPYGTPPYCKDGPSHDVLLNPDVPAQVRGPQGSAPTGPASVPTDSPSGCPGTCQNSATASAPVANTRMTQSVVPDPPQVQAPVTAVPTIPATAVATGPAGGTCGVDAMGIPVDDC
ncbi:hypothetical protein EYC59_04535 [Candidatus Saccharibacteria bacterium]|nr:MAG: hypothetical protein EYC59_04535 [Candidatus Saccharibacteria bacterium]